MTISCLIPVYHSSVAEVSHLLKFLPNNFGIPLIIFNDNDYEVEFYLRSLEESKKIQLLHIPYQVGKARAVQLGLQYILKNSDAEVFLQVSARSKQPMGQVISLVEHLLASQAHMVVGNRYKLQDMEGQIHRMTVASFFSIIVRYITGYELIDTVCGTRVYFRSLAEEFACGRSFGYGLEMEELLIAAIKGYRVADYPLESNRQADSTNAEKLEDNMFALISYAHEMNLSTTLKNSFHHVLSHLKRRKSFDVNLQPFGGVGSTHFEYVGGGETIVDSYTNQVAEDAYRSAPA